VTSYNYAKQSGCFSYNAYMTAKKQKSLRNRLVKTFVPHRHNGYRPWISRIPGLASIIAILVILHLGYNSLGLHRLETVDTVGSNSELLSDVNKNRAQVGAGSLKADKRLNAAAQAKAEDMIKQDYWAHVAPDGTEAWNFIGQEKYFYEQAAENLARGFRTPEGVVAGWQASPAHRQAMQDSDYSEVGFGVVDGRLKGENTTVVVALFAKPLQGASLQAVSGKKNVLAVQGQAARLTTGSKAVEFSLFNPLSVGSTLSLPGEIALVMLSLLVIIYIAQHYLIKRRSVVWDPKLHQLPVIRILIILLVIGLIISTSFGSIG
jgi:hypothetical protein